MYACLKNLNRFQLCMLPFSERNSHSPHCRQISLQSPPSGFSEKCASHFESLSLVLQYIMINQYIFELKSLNSTKGISNNYEFYLHLASSKPRRAINFGDGWLNWQFTSCVAKHTSSGKAIFNLIFFTAIFKSVPHLTRSFWHLKPWCSNDSVCPDC